MARKTRVDSTQGALAAMSAALSGPLLPPNHLTLRDVDMPYWTAIVSARAREKWDELDLVMAFQLAQTMADIGRLNRELAAEGHVIENFRGTPIANPKHSVVETLIRRETSLTRALHISANAKNGDPRSQGKALKKERDAGQVLGDADEDLIPRPRASH